MVYGIRGQIEALTDKIQPILAAIDRVQAAHPSLFVGGFGDATAKHAIEGTLQQDLAHAEIFSLLLTLVIRLVAFASLLAAGMPVLLAFSGVVAAGGLATLASHLVAAADATQSIVLMIRLAVGVDYSLFHIRRAREEHRQGLSNQEAPIAAASTSGQAILVSGWRWLQVSSVSLAMACPRRACTVSSRWAASAAVVRSSTGIVRCDARVFGGPNRGGPPGSRIICRSTVTVRRRKSTRSTVSPNASPCRNPEAAPRMRSAR